MAYESGHHTGGFDWQHLHAVHLQDTTWTDMVIAGCDQSWDNPNPCSLFNANLGADTYNRIHVIYSRADSSGTETIFQSFDGSIGNLLCSWEFDEGEYFSLTENSKRLGINFTRGDSIFVSILTDTILTNPKLIPKSITISQNRNLDNVFDEDGNLLLVWQGKKNANDDIFFVIIPDSFLTSVDGNDFSEQSDVSREYHLYQNYPNPFNSMTKIIFKLNQPSFIRLKIFNLAGQLVKTLAEGKFSSGTHQLTWDGIDEFGRKIASGIYYYQITTETGSQMKKMVFLQ